MEPPSPGSEVNGLGNLPMPLGPLLKPYTWSPAIGLRPSESTGENTQSFLQGSLSRMLA